MSLVEYAADEMVERLAEATARRLGFRRIDVVPKVAACLAQLDQTERFGFAGQLIAAAPNDPAWLDFVERLLVHETYFFRHPAQLELLRDQVLPELDTQRRNAGRTALVVWNAGCSTGEESWTLALLAGDSDDAAAIPLSILATDLSEVALAKARSGTYDRLHGLDSFRAIPPWAIGHFLRRDGSAWCVPDGVRRGVSFLRHNLLDPPPLASADLIVCRNTLIYFDAPANRRVQDNLAAALRPGGVLVLGAADTLRTSCEFEVIASRGATAYRKTTGL
ncbi:MAG TPA: protein-glutamate O-methyltransferase CheR [Bradyrhizobium sp.]|nr:protein-glutamate O-methyltransferase CheR [Bradyrhizobium sp.]